MLIADRILSYASAIERLKIQDMALRDAVSFYKL